MIGGPALSLSRWWQLCLKVYRHWAGWFVSNGVHWQTGKVIRLIRQHDPVSTRDIGQELLRPAAVRRMNSECAETGILRPIAQAIEQTVEHLVRDAMLKSQQIPERK